MSFACVTITFAACLEELPPCSAHPLALARVAECGKNIAIEDSGSIVRTFISSFIFVDGDGVDDVMVVNVYETDEPQISGRASGFFEKFPRKGIPNLNVI